MIELEEATRALLQNMVQRVLDGQGLLREDNRNMRRRLARIEQRLSRVEQTLLAVQQVEVDHAAADTGMQEQIDALTDRIERLEERTS